MRSIFAGMPRIDPDFGIRIKNGVIRVGNPDTVPGDHGGIQVRREYA